VGRSFYLILAGGILASASNAETDLPKGFDHYSTEKGRRIGRELGFTPGFD
jgi:hypothetical protein